MNALSPSLYRPCGGRWRVVPSGTDATGSPPRVGLRERELRDGDELRLCQHGAAVFRVGVWVAASCAECGARIPEDGKEGCRRAPGVYQCEACAARPTRDERRRAPRSCARCGRDVSAEAGAGRPGAFVCAAYRDNPERLVRGLTGPPAAACREPAAIAGHTILEEPGRGGVRA